jgi:hypothetical protein
MIKSTLNILILLTLLSCSNSNKKPIEESNKKEKTEKKERPRTRIFPIIMAGSISLVQKFYLKK